jgi:hypothetical protein
MNNNHEYYENLDAAFADLVELDPDFDGFWAPMPGDTIRGVLLERTEMVNIVRRNDAGDMVPSHVLKVELHSSARAYASDEKGNAIEGGEELTKGQVIAVWENFKTASLVPFAHLRPAIQLEYKGMVDTKGGNTMHNTRCLVDRRSFMRNPAMMARGVAAEAKSLGDGFEDGAKA